MRKAYGERDFARTKERKFTQAKLSAALLAGSLVLTACGASINANGGAIHSCDGVEAQFDYRGSNFPVEDTGSVVSQVRNDVTILYGRTMRAGGSISFGTNQPNGESLTATTTTLTLGVTSEQFSSFADDTLTFGIRNGKPLPIAVGAVVCGGDNNLYPKGVVSDLNSLVGETAALPS